MVLSDKVKIHAGLVGEFQNFQMIAIQVDVGARRDFMLLHVIEQSKLHFQILTWRFSFGFLAAANCRSSTATAPIRRFDSALDRTIGYSHRKRSLQTVDHVRSNGVKISILTLVTRLE
jgi:hypothetical protein